MPAMARVGVEVSSVVCELTIAEWVGSKVSSLCSPLVKSVSAETEARNRPAPTSGSSVESNLAVRSCSTLWRYSRRLRKNRTARVIHAFRAIQQIAAHIQNGYRFRSQAFDGARDQMRDRGNRGIGQRRASPDFDQHAGFRRLLRFAEDRFLRERDVDARLLHFSPVAMTERSSSPSSARR